MTPTAPAPAATLRTAAVLFGRRDDAVEGLARALGEHRVLRSFGKALGRLTAAGSRAVCHRIAEAATDLADVDVQGVVVAGWQRYTALVDAARRTVEDPGSDELVDLASHTIRSVHRPQVDVLVDGVRAGTVPFALEVDVVVQALVATVRTGRLTEIHVGRGRLAATLSCLDIALAAHEADVDLGAVVSLGSAGVPLVAQQPPETGWLPPVTGPSQGVSPPA